MTILACPLFVHARLLQLRDDDRKDPDVLAYLEAENSYTTAAMADTEALQSELYKEMRARIKEEDTSVATRWACVLTAFTPHGTRVRFAIGGCDCLCMQYNTINSKRDVDIQFRSTAVNCPCRAIKLTSTRAFAPHP